MTGVTGARPGAFVAIQKNLREIKRYSDTPLCVGFGISRPEQAAQAAEISDGVIVGSAVVDYVHHHAHESASLISRRVIRPFARALKKERADG